MGAILIRYGETGLKGPKVRAGFLRLLMESVQDKFADAKVEFTADRVMGRDVLTTPDTERGLELLSTTFGIVSASAAVEMPSDMDSLKEGVARLSRDLMGQGSTFAIRARRTGTHPYTSMDVQREVGSAVWTANRDREITVELGAPDVTIEVEIRGPTAFVYTGRVPGPGGLPYGSGGRMLCLLRTERDALAAWMMMRRGCRTYFFHEPDMEETVRPWMDVLRLWVPGIRSRPLVGPGGGENGPGGDEESRLREGAGQPGRGGGEDLPSRLRYHMVGRRAGAFISGASLEEVEAGGVVLPDGDDVLALYPLVGMGEKEMRKLEVKSRFLRE